MEVDPVQTSITSPSAAADAPVRTRHARTTRRSVTRSPSCSLRRLEGHHKRRRKQDPVNDEDASTVGCLSFLKKISCTLSCGGTTCSIKETEPLSSSSSTGSSPTTTGSSAATPPSPLRPEAVSAVQTPQKKSTKRAAGAKRAPKKRVCLADSAARVAPEAAENVSLP